MFIKTFFLNFHINDYCSCALFWTLELIVCHICWCVLRQLMTKCCHICWCVLRQLMTKWRRKLTKLRNMQEMTRSQVQKSYTPMCIPNLHLAFRSVVVIHSLTMPPNDQSDEVVPRLHCIIPVLRLHSNSTRSRRVNGIWVMCFIMRAYAVIVIKLSRC